MNLIKDLQYHFWDSNQNAVCTFDRNAKCYQNSKKGKEIYIFNCPCSNVFEVNVVKEKQNIEACSRKTVTFNVFGWNEREKDTKVPDKNVHQHTHADAHTHTHTQAHTHTHITSHTKPKWIKALYQFRKSVPSLSDGNS